jgi:hypothetical protein
MVCALSSRAEAATYDVDVNWKGPARVPSTIKAVQARPALPGSPETKHRLQGLPQPTTCRRPIVSPRPLM